MLVNRLNKRVKILRLEKDRDDFGEPIDLWEEVCRFGASIEPSGDVNLLLAMTENAEVTTIRIRYREGIDRTMKVEMATRNSDSPHHKPGICKRSFNSCARAAIAMTRVNFKIEGMRELQKASKTSASTKTRHHFIAKRYEYSPETARQTPHMDTGALKQGIIMVGEKARTKGKKVYRIVFDRMNEIFKRKTRKVKLLRITLSTRIRFSRKTGDISWIPVSYRGAFREQCSKDGKHNWIP